VTVVAMHAWWPRQHDIISSVGHMGSELVRLLVGGRYCMHRGTGVVPEVLTKRANLIKKELKALIDHM
jgi:hypothetical protein